MHDLAIVGGGFWGVATALLAERQGAKVALVDKRTPEAASVAAAGLFARKWFKGAWRERIDRAAEDAASFGVEAQAKQGMMSTIAARKARMPMVDVQDWCTFSPQAFLDKRKPDYDHAVTSVRKGVVVCEGLEVEARNVVVAAGAHTDNILRASGIAPLGVKGLQGSALVYEGAFPDMLLMHQVTPYFQYTLRAWGDGARLGDTLERVPAKGDAYVEKMHATMASYLESFGLKRSGRMQGARPVLPEPTVRTVAPGVIAATGGGRIGALMAFWAGRQVCKLM